VKIEHTLVIDDVPELMYRRDKERFRCVGLTGFDPDRIADLEIYQRVLVIERTGAAKLAREVEARMLAVMPEGTRVDYAVAYEPGVESTHSTDDDLSLARRFLDERQRELRYVVDVERWLVWNKRFWGGLYDTTGRGKAMAMLQRFMAKVGRERAAEIRKKAETGTEEEKAKAHAVATQVEGRFRSSAMLSNVWRQTDVMAQDSDTTTLVQADLNRDPYLLNCPNGLVDLRTGELRPHDPAELCTGMTRVPYDPDAKATSFGWFLAEAQPTEENRHYLRRRSGLMLLGVQRTHVFLVDVGLEGRNGKGLLAGTLRWVMGSYATTADSSMILVGRNERHPTTVASLVHRRFCWIDETRQQRSLDAARIKEFSGGAPRKAYFMKKDEFTYEPSDTMLLTTNYMPRFEGMDKAFMARLQMLPWDVSFYGREDEDLPERLKLEGEGILAWAVRGCMEYLEKGLQPPTAVVERTEEERREHDPIGTWLDEHIVLDAGDRVHTKWLAMQYLTQTGVRPHPDVDFTKVFGKAMSVWIRGRKRDSSWDVSEDQWREPLLGKGRGWAGIRYEEG
jgi:putative DNA primase/helicase